MIARSPLVGLLTSIAIVAACTQQPPTTPTPSPTPTVEATVTEPVGARVAVVLPVAGDQPLTAEAVRAGLDRIRAEAPEGLGELRAVQPDGPGFTADVVRLLATDGYDLVCVVGSGALDAVLAAARDLPEIRFCAFPAYAEQVPENLLLVDARFEQTAYLAGIGAAQLLVPSGGPEEAEPTPLRPGFVAGPGAAVTGDQQRAFETGLQAALGQRVDPVVAVPAVDAEVGQDLAASVFSGGAPVVFSVAGEADEGVLAAAEQAGGTVILYRPASTERPPEPTLLVLEIDPVPALTLAITGLLESSPGGLERLGLTDGTLGVAPGTHPRAEQVMATVRGVANDIMAGRRTVRGPTPTPSPTG